jgi:hypothetical protein
MLSWLKFLVILPSPSRLVWITAWFCSTYSSPTVSSSALYFVWSWVLYHKRLMIQPTFLARLSFREIYSFRLKPHWRTSLALWNSIKLFPTGQTPCIKLANSYWLIRYSYSNKFDAVLHYLPIFSVILIIHQWRYTCRFVCIWEVYNSIACLITVYTIRYFKGFLSFDMMVLWNRSQSLSSHSLHFTCIIIF